MDDLCYPVIPNQPCLKYQPIPPAQGLPPCCRQGYRTAGVGAMPASLSCCPAVCPPLYRREVECSGIDGQLCERHQRTTRCRLHCFLHIARPLCRMKYWLSRAKNYGRSRPVAVATAAAAAEARGQVDVAVTSITRYQTQRDYTWVPQVRSCQHTSAACSLCFFCYCWCRRLNYSCYDCRCSLHASGRVSGHNLRSFPVFVSPNVWLLLLLMVVQACSDRLFQRQLIGSQDFGSR